MPRPIQLSLLLVATTVLGCASGGTTSTPGHEPERVLVTDERGRVYRTNNENTSEATRVHSAAPSAFAALVQTYADVGVPVGTLDGDHGQIGNKHFRPSNHQLAGKHLSVLVDCGNDPISGPRAELYDVTMSVLSVVAPDGDSASVVTTSVEAYARPAGVSSDWTHCTSTGYLERTISGRLQRALIG